METLFEISQMLLSDILKIQVWFRRKPWNLSLHCPHSRTNSSFFPLWKPGSFHTRLGLCPKATPDPSYSPSLLAPSSCCFTAGSRTPPRSLLQQLCWELEHDTAIELLCLSTAEGLACMNTSSPFPAVTASLAALIKLLGNVNDALWRKAPGLGRYQSQGSPKSSSTPRTLCI